MNVEEIICKQGLCSSTLINMKCAYVYVALVTTTLIAEGFGLTCLNCRGIVQPRHCKYVTQCEPFEYCSAERVETEIGEDVYNLGCRPVTACNSTTSNMCNECCGTDLCNAHSCEEPDYPIQRGPICYNCQDYPAERYCHEISFCIEGQVCSIVTAKEFGDNITTRACVSQLSCARGVQSPVVGRRSLDRAGSHGNVGDNCDVCCSRDLCNVNCEGHTDTTYDPCSPNPCHNGSTCSVTGVGYTCMCPPGFFGKHCEEDINECLSDPCLHGSCIDVVNGFTCSCYPGYIGTICELVYDSCSSSPCHNGTCTYDSSGYTCHCPPGMTGTQCDQVIYRDCQEILTSGSSAGSGVYTVYLRNLSLDLAVYCDMETDGGGWTVFQRRIDGQEEFYRNFSDYEYGFGNVSAEYWLGLMNIQEMTKDRPDLRLDLTTFENKTGSDTYKGFYMTEPPYYELHIRSGSRNASFSGSQSLFYNVGHRFSTYDQGNTGCAKSDHGAWWYRICSYVNLNGYYVKPGHYNPGRIESGVIYFDFGGNGSLKTTKMMFRKK